MLAMTEDNECKTMNANQAEIRPHPFSGNAGGYCLLGSGWQSPGVGWRLQPPWQVIEARSVDQVLPALQALEARQQAGCAAIGWIGYEAAAAWHDGLTHDKPGALPLLHFAVAPARQLQAIERFEEQPAAVDEAVAPLALPVDEDQFARAIEQIQAHIASGYTYQVNYTLRAAFACAIEPKALFGRLYQAQPVPYAGHVHLPDGQHVFSLSPELFLHRQADQLRSRPMKGTCPRGRFTAEDEALAAALQSSPKERAENVMIVDMVRNDLGQICQTGSVQVESLLAVERYRTVQQMTSQVRGQLPPGTSLGDILQALFPAASITGAPKRKTMQIINGLEDAAREVYCGALGLLHPGGDFLFNVAIRTLWGQDGRYRVGVGSGIVWDAKPRQEYAELQTKAAFVSASPPDFQLIETMALGEDGAYILLEEHLERLRDSAAYWRFPLDEEALRDRLAQIAQAHRGQRLKVRLTLDATGALALTTGPVTSWPSSRTVRIAPQRVHSQDRYLFHKTTHRTLYNQQRQRDQHEGYFESLFLNQHGHLTEGCITNLFLRKAHTWYTPPVADGLLPGVWRREMIRQLGAREASLTLQDALDADEIMLGNSVMGSVRDCHLAAQAATATESA